MEIGALFVKESNVKEIRGMTRNMSTSGMMGAGVCLVAALSAPSTGMAAEAAAAAPATVHERAGGPVGVGFIMGDTDGLSLKVWGNPSHALQVNLGSASNLNSVAMDVVYQYHFRPIQVADNLYSLPFYVGGGGHYKVASSSGATYMEGGLATVVGMSILVPDLPVELFVELSPQVVLYNPSVGIVSGASLGFQMNGGMGIHYYF